MPAMRWIGMSSSTLPVCHDREESRRGEAQFFGLQKTAKNEFGRSLINQPDAALPDWEADAGLVALHRVVSIAFQCAITRFATHAPSPPAW